MNKCSGGQLRYKGIENFLRRLAFNLGNSASQTDVKIISCIPIDVTDLHQKVICLEKELQDRINSSNVDCETYPVTVHHNNPLKYQTCNVQHNVPQLSVNTPDTTPTPVSADEVSSSNNIVIDKKGLLPPAAAKTDHQKKKKFKKTFKTQHLVYHVRADTPLHFTANFRRNTSKQPAARSSRSMNQHLHLDKDRSSEISTPICRDFSNHKQNFESDSCSCCQGNFANIDDHIKHHCYTKKCELHRLNVDNNSRRYYDSNLYDLVPVRENIKPRKYLKETTKKINDVYRNMEILNRREHVDHRKKVYPTASERNRPHVNKGVTVNVDQIIETRKSHTCDIDCGQIYAKKSSQRNANNSSATTNNCNDQPDINSYSNDDEQKISNEKCLNEIKSILQNVLQEIKMTAKDKMDIAAASAAAAARSSDVKHYRRSTLDMSGGCCGPYGASPYQLASCSLSFPSAGLCPAVPYMHPMMMPTGPPAPASRLCARHLRRATGSDESAQSTPEKTSAGTSTRDRDQPAPPAPTQHAQPAVRTNETDLLIREIYKCLSLSLDSGESARGGAAGGGPGGGEVGTSERKFVSQSGTHSALDRISERAEKESRVDLTSGESSSGSSGSSSSSDVVVPERRPKVKEPSCPKANNFISKIVNFLKKKKPNRADSLRHSDRETGTEDSEARSDDEYTTIYSEGRRPGDDRQPPTKTPSHLYNKYKRRPHIEQDTRRQLAERLTHRDNPAHYWQNVEARQRVRKEQPHKLHIHVKPLNSKVKINKNTGLTWLKKYKSGVRQC